MAKVRVFLVLEMETDSLSAQEMATEVNRAATDALGSFQLDTFRVWWDTWPWSFDWTEVITS